MIRSGGDLNAQPRGSIDCVYDCAGRCVRERARRNDMCLKGTLRTSVIHDRHVPMHIKR